MTVHKFGFFSLSLLLISCGQTKTLEEVNYSSEVSAPNEEVIAVFAKVVRQPVVNKAGRVMEGNGQFYLVYNGEEKFIKFSESDIDPADLEPYLDQSIEFRLVEREGLWDTDDPNVQSRVGKYVAVIELVVK